MNVSRRHRAGMCATAGLTWLVLAGAAIGASAGFDGMYRGESIITRGDESVCGKTTHPVAFSVVNGQFSIVWDPRRNIGINLVVGPDGSFSGSQKYKIGQTGTAELTASGHVAGNVLEGSIEGQACARRYHLTKS